MKRIFKYQLEARPTQTIAMPRDAKILHVSEQRGNVCVWALIDENPKEMDARKFEVVETGGELHGFDGKHLGTLLLENGDYVIHIFEVA